MPYKYHHDKLYYDRHIRTGRGYGDGSRQRTRCYCDLCCPPKPTQAPVEGKPQEKDTAPPSAK